MTMRFLIAVVTCLAVILAGIKYPNWQFALTIQAAWLGILLFAASEAVYGSTQNRFSFVAFVIGGLYAMNGDGLSIILYACFKLHNLTHALNPLPDIDDLPYGDVAFFRSTIEPALSSICFAIVCFVGALLVSTYRQHGDRLESK